MFKKSYVILIFCILFFAVRLPFLGHDNFNTDVWKWKSRIFDFGTGVFTMQYEKTLQRYHPGVTLMWIGSVGIKIYNLYYDVFIGHPPLDDSVKTIFELDMVQKALITLVIFSTLLTVYYVLSKLFGKVFALISVSLVSLEPFYVALTRVVHLEGLMSTFILAAIVWLFYWYKRGGKYSLYITAFFTALAILTKSSALFLLPFVGLFIFYTDWLKTKKFLGSVISSLAIYVKWFGLIALIIFLLWPALWVIPTKVFDTIFRGVSDVGVDGGHDQFYFGQYVSDPGWTFYFVVLAFKTSIIGLLGALLSIIFFKKFSADKKEFGWFLLSFLVLYMVQLVIPSKKLDRYVLPALMVLVMFSGLFFDYLYHVNKQIKSKVGILLFIFGFSLWSLFTVQPDYFSYYNPMFGGLAKGIFVVEPKWLIGEPEIISKLLEIKDKDNLDSFQTGESIDKVLKSSTLDSRLTVGFQEKYYTQIWPFVREMGGWAIIESLRDYAIHTKYFVYPVWEDTGLSENRFKLEYVDTVKIRGVDTWRVYRRIP